MISRKTRRVNFVLTEEMCEHLDDLAESMGVTRSELMRLLVNNAAAVVVMRPVFIPVIDWKAAKAACRKNVLHPIPRELHRSILYWLRNGMATQTEIARRLGVTRQAIHWIVHNGAGR